MGLLERFKKSKEKELGAATPKVVSTTKSNDKKEIEKIQKKQEKIKTKIVSADTARIIIGPLVTEKAAQLSVLNTYVFQIVRTATRTEVAVAFKELYGIKPTRVNMVNLRAEPVHFGRSKGKRTAWKKAIITIPKGKTIQIYEGV